MLDLSIELLVKKEFKIGAVSEKLEVPIHTLRYWEKEFEILLTPPRTQGGQRLYDSVSIHTIKKIKKLLWNDMYSIKGAKKVLAEEL